MFSSVPQHFPTTLSSPFSSPKELTWQRGGSGDWYNLSFSTEIFDHLYPSPGLLADLCNDFPCKISCLDYSLSCQFQKTLPHPSRLQGCPLQHLTSWFWVHTLCFFFGTQSPAAIGTLPKESLWPLTRWSPVTSVGYTHAWPQDLATHNLWKGRVTFSLLTSHTLPM